MALFILWTLTVVTLLINNDIKVNGNIHVDVSVLKKKTYQGTNDDPVLDEEYIGIFMEASGVDYLTCCEMIEAPPEDYLLIEYHIKVQNKSDIQLEFINVGRPLDEGVWLFYGKDGKPITINPGENVNCVIWFIAKNTKENKTKDFTFPVKLQYVYDNGLFEKNIEFCVIP